jgi:hypothetical protein
VYLCACCSFSGVNLQATTDHILASHSSYVQASTKPGCEVHKLVLIVSADEDEFYGPVDSLHSASVGLIRIYGKLWKKGVTPPPPSPLLLICQ